MSLKRNKASHGHADGKYFQKKKASPVDVAIRLIEHTHQHAVSVVPHAQGPCDTREKSGDHPKMVQFQGLFWVMPLIAWPCCFMQGLYPESY